MIVYFANRTMDILGLASTELLNGFTISEDLKVEEIETGIDTFEGYISFNKETRAKVEKCVAEGNYILRNSDNKDEFYTIVEVEIDTKKQRVYFYAENGGLDLINEIVGDFEATEAQPISYYINKFAYDAGFKIKVNEVSTLTRKLKWEGEQTVTERLASVATQFDGCEISYSFKIKGLKVVNKYINIYEKRGKNDGVQLRLNKEIDSIITTKTIANVATALLCEGGTPDNADDPITLKGYVYDDGDYFVNGKILYSRKALAKWGRYVWEDEPNQILGNHGHIIRPFSYDTTSQATLCKKAISELKQVQKAEVNYEVDIKKLPDNVRIGDTVNVIDDAGNLYLSTRLLKLETSECDKTIKATLGEFLLKKSGISSKVAKLAADFAKQTVSVKRAVVVAKNATALAEAAQQQANEALTESENALNVSNEAKQAVETATQSAAEATEKADAAQKAVDVVEKSVESLETTVTNAQQAANNAQLAANTATEKAEEAKQAAQNAETQATEAKTAATNAETNSNTAIEKAETAEETANTAKETAESASGIANNAKADAEKAVEDVEKWADNLTTYKQTVEAEYSRKTELTETKANLQAQITANANELDIVHTKVLTVDETAADAKEKADAAQQQAANAQSQADEATAAAQAAQTEAYNAKQAAQNAQAEADTAKQAAATAQSVADQAEADLAKAKEDLSTVTSRVNATEEEIAAAQQAVETAQAAADKAKADALTATEKATTAQNTADTAVTNASNAQQAADEAAEQAELAQQIANEAKGNAATAQQTADEAKQKAEAAQSTANTAKANAETAQSKADEAAADALLAQQAANAADTKAQQAKTDLATAQQNLENVTSRVGATEEEIAAAQKAVETAQKAADDAQAEAEAAQATANTAKENAATAQQAADDAKTAADNAQQAADEAKQAADKAQEDVNSLAVRVTAAETAFEKTNEQIGMLATKDEVSQTLGGYYTKSEADAAILAKASEINLSVDSKVSGVQIGGRNLLKNSRHITLNSNNNALYPISYTTETENSREFRRYRRTESTLSPTTMSLYSAIPVNQITDCLTGKEITFSFLIRCSHSTTTNIMSRIVVNGVNYNFAPEPQQNIGAEWQRLSVTATITQEYEVNGSNILRFNPLLIPIPDGAIDTFYIDVCEWKIEKGNKATDWIPAPEDIDDKFSNYSTIEEMNSAINLKAEGIFSTVKETYTSKEDFNNLDIGGRNLVRDSSLKEKTDMWSFSSDNTYSFENGYCEIYRETTNGSRTFVSQSTNANKLLKPDNLAGGTFTLAAEIKLLDGYSITDASSLFYRCNTTELSSGFQEIAVKLGGATAEWQKVHAVFTFGDYNFDGSCQVCIALENAVNVGICVRNIKLEKGNKATDWTSAPEDAESEIDNLQDAVTEHSSYSERITAAETKINQLSHTIAMLVRDAEGQSQMTQSSTEAEYAFFSTEEIDKAIEDTSKILDDLNAEYGDTKAAVETLRQTLADYGERVKFSTYEDEPCIILYENDSNYKQIITNTRRIFIKTTNNVDRILSITDFESVETKRIVATENLQIGGYVLKTLGNGSVVLAWEGVAE